MGVALEQRASVLMGAVNGAVALLVAAWFVAMVLEAITSSPTWDEVE